MHKHIPVESHLCNEMNANASLFNILRNFCYFAKIKKKPVWMFETMVSFEYKGSIYT